MTKQALYWLIALSAFVAGAWLCLGQPVPPLPSKAKPLLSPKDAANRAMVLFIPPTPRTNEMAWQLKPTSNVWYNVQSTTDLLNWQTIVTNATGVTTVTNRGERMKLFRLVGRYQP